MTELQRIVADAGLGDGQPRLTLMAGGFSNTNYRMELGNRQYVLRLYREPELAKKEAMLAELVQDTVPVPTILFWSANPQIGGKAYAISKFVQGVPLQDLIGST